MHPGSSCDTQLFISGVRMELTLASTSYDSPRYSCASSCTIASTLALNKPVTLTALLLARAGVLLFVANLLGDFITK